MLAAGMLAVTSCTDFSDYNDTDEGSFSPEGNMTLWESIQQNANLSDFKTLVERSGFSEALSQSHYYTVWAPANGTFNVSDYASLDNDLLLKQFVYNHVADYGHSASGSVEERVTMLNGKKYNFTGTGKYTFNDVEVSQANIPSNNGVIHMLNGAAIYYPNLYDFLTDTVKAKELAVDSISRYFKTYENSVLDEKASVLGPIVNGRQTYSDSVMKVTNSIANSLRADLEVEDSSYTLLVPTNTAWEKQYAQIQNYFNYIGTTSAQLFTTTASGSIELSSSPTTFKVDNPAFLQDSLTKRSIVRNLVFSNSNPYNQWLEGEAAAGFTTDTLVSSVGSMLTNTVDLTSTFMKEKIRFSNGVGRLVDSLASYSWETYAPEYSYKATYNTNIARILNGNSTRWNKIFLDRTIGEYAKDGSMSYLCVEPNGGYAKPELDVYLSNVLSTTYDLYCVFVPEYFDNTKIESIDELLPNRVNFKLNYCDANGNLVDTLFLDTSDANKDSCASYLQRVKDEKGTSGTITMSASNKNVFYGFSNDPTKVDTVYIGRVTFPVSYYGLGTNTNRICPNIKITSPFSATNATFRAAFKRDLRIAAVLAKPVELVEFEEQNKQ